MNITLAKLEDLKQIQEMYTKIIENMYKNNIKIWNEYYPNIVFASDIKNKNLYLLKENNNIIGAFVLCEHKNIEKDIKWKNINEKAYILNRLGVSVNYLHQGIGKLLVKSACEIAKNNNAKYLRLLVDETNIPAINLYKKCNLIKRPGKYKEIIKEDFYISEYGYEIKLK